MCAESRRKKGTCAIDVRYSISGTHAWEENCLTFVLSTQVFDPERKRENVESAGRLADGRGGTWSSISGSYPLGGAAGGSTTWSNSSDLCNLTATLLAVSPRKFLCTSPPQVSFA